MKLSSLALRKIFYFKTDSDTLESPATNKRKRGNMWRRLELSLLAHSAPITVSQYMRTLQEFCRILEIGFNCEKGAELLKTVTRDDVNEYINWCRSRPAQSGRSASIGDTVSLSTVRKKIVMLFSVFSHLKQLEQLSENPFQQALFDYKRHTGGDRRETKMVSFDKVRELFTISPTDTKDVRDLAMLAALFGGGLRRSEVSGLRMMDVQSKEGGMFLLLRNTKAQKAALQYILPWAAKHIERYVAIRKKEGASANDALFIAYSGRTPSTKPISDATIYLMFIEWMKKIGLDETFTPHSARATAITLLLERGKTHRTVMKFSRHRSPEMVSHYDKLRTINNVHEFEDVDL